jgi:hypothetical protein
MKLDEIVKLLEADVVTRQRWESIEITTACAADLMSDVLAFTKAGAILITGLVNPQCVRTAEMVEIRAICFIRGKMPPPETIRLAEEAGIPLLRARFSSYVVSGMLFSTGLLGCDGSV